MYFVLFFYVLFIICSVTMTVGHDCDALRAVFLMTNHYHSFYDSVRLLAMTTTLSTNNFLEQEGNGNIINVFPIDLLINLFIYANHRDAHYPSILSCV